MQQLIYDPAKSGKRMTIVCFISGSGTNYREIVKRNRQGKQARSHRTQSYALPQRRP
jgi:hypothetical protein